MNQYIERVLAETKAKNANEPEWMDGFPSHGLAGPCPRRGRPWSACLRGSTGI